jgi:hypothetical protein
VSRFQQGSLFRLERKTRPDVWVFRWYDNTSGKRTYKKKIIGSVAQLRNRREVEKAVAHFVVPLMSMRGHHKISVILRLTVECTN